MTNLGWVTSALADDSGQKTAPDDTVMARVVSSLELPSHPDPGAMAAKSVAQMRTIDLLSRRLDDLSNRFDAICQQLG
jgi:hypothetical protein